MKGPVSRCRWLEVDGALVHFQLSHGRKLTPEDEETLREVVRETRRALNTAHSFEANPRVPRYCRLCGRAEKSHQPAPAPEARP